MGPDPRVTDLVDDVQGFVQELHRALLLAGLGERVAEIRQELDPHYVPGRQEVCRASE